MEDKGAGGGVAEAVETPLKPIRIRGSRPTPSEASSGPPLPELPELVVQKGADDVPLLYFHSGCKSLTPPPPVTLCQSPVLLDLRLARKITLVVLSIGRTVILRFLAGVVSLLTLAKNLSLLQSYVKNVK